MPFSAHLSVISKKRNKVSACDSGSIVCVRDISVGYKMEIHLRGSLLARILRGVAHHEETTAGNEQGEETVAATVGYCRHQLRNARRFIIYCE